MGYDVRSLAIIEDTADGKIRFRDEEREEI